MKNLRIIDKIKNSLYPVVTFLIILIIWQLVVEGFNIPQYILPSPMDIIGVFFTDYENLYLHTVVTLNEALLGFILSIIIALVMGILMDFIPIFKKCFYPIMLVTQTIPTITIAPLLIIWFGFGILPKILMVTLTCFFPILINFVDGMENLDRDYLNLFIAPLLIIWFGFGILPKILMVTLTCFFPILINFVDGMENLDRDYLNLFKTMNASKLNTFIHLKFPMSMDKLFSGLKISSTYAVMAATVAEWLGGSQGLGVYMVRSKSAYALDKVFASTLVVVVTSLIFVGIIQGIRKIALRHKN